MLKTQMIKLKILALLSAGVLWAAPAWGADSAKGQALADTHCVRCHGAKVGDTSPNPKAPVLASFQAKWPLTYLEEALAEGIVTGHDNDMPTFSFTAEEIDNLFAYLDSLGAD